MVCPNCNNTFTASEYAVCPRCGKDWRTFVGRPPTVINRDPTEDDEEYNVRDFMADGLSPNGGSYTDSITAINNAITGASNLAIQRGLNRVRLGGFGRATYQVGESVLMKSRVHLDLDEAVLIRRADPGGGFIRNSVAAGYGDGYQSMKISGGTVDPNGIPQTVNKLGVTANGNIVQLVYVLGLTIDGLRILHNLPAGSETWALGVGGRNGRVSNVEVIGGNGVFEDGIHLTHGQDWKLNDCYVESGDDAIVLGGEPQGISLTYPDAIRRVVGTGLTVRSERGTAIKVYQSQGATGTEWEITDFNLSVVGRSGISRNGGIALMDRSTDGVSGTGQIKRGKIQALLEVGQTSGHDGTNPYLVFGESTEDVEITGTVRNAGGMVNRYFLNRNKGMNVSLLGGESLPDSIALNNTALSIDGVPVLQVGQTAPSTPGGASTLLLPASSSRRHYTRFQAPRSMRVTKIAFAVSIVSSTDDTFDVGVVNQDLTAVLASSGNKTSVSGGVSGGGLNSTGTKVITLTTPVSLRKGQTVYIALNSTNGASPATVVADTYGAISAVNLLGLTVGQYDSGLENVAPPLTTPIAITGTATQAIRFGVRTD